jgi:hypothetical protein
MNKYLLLWTEPEQIGPDDWYENKCYRLCDNKYQMMNKLVNLFDAGIFNVIVSEVDADFDIKDMQ